MIGKKGRCAVCGGKLSFAVTQIYDGFICPVCNRICTGSPLVTTEQVRSAWSENHRRFYTFKSGMVISNFTSGYLFVDLEQKMFFLSNSKHPKLEPVVFKFSEINSFRIEQVGQKTITKTKGGIGRAVVGGTLFGATGAIVGATTAKQQTKEVGGVPILYVDLAINGLNTTISISNPPIKAADYLENAMNNA